MPGEEALMMPMLAGAGIGAAGSLASSALGLWGASRQMKFQERMSNSAYQRASEDMRKAGLNPMLMYSKGAPASTPSGASFQPENPFREAGQAIGKGLELKLTNARIANETASTQAGVREAAARTALIDQQVANARIDQELKAKELGRSGLVSDKLTAEIQGILADIDVRKSQLPVNSAHARELDARADRERAVADVIKSLAPIVTRGANAIQGLIDYLSNPNTSTWEEIKPFLPSSTGKALTHDGMQWGLLRGPSIIKDRVLDALRSIGKTGTTIGKTFNNDPGGTP
jgi:hypothetical protein